MLSDINFKPPGGEKKKLFGASLYSTNEKTDLRSSYLVTIYKFAALMTTAMVFPAWFYNNLRSFFADYQMLL